MSVLFNDIVFGPINSRRFGYSLGINLLPLDNKVCNFNCVYCECGWTDLKNKKVSYFPFDTICHNIESSFKDWAHKQRKPESITFAGNGEPTMHPKFLEIMKEVIILRDAFLSGVPITVLSNSELLGNKKVWEGLMLADKRVLKLDAGTNEMFTKINLPLSGKNIEWYIDKLKLFDGKLIIQTIFLKGHHNGSVIDNTTDKEVSNWLNILEKIKPTEVMIYTIDRDTPLKTLYKIDKDKLNDICDKAKRLGISAKVYN